MNSNSISSSVPKRGRRKKKSSNLPPCAAIASHFVRIPSGNPAKNRAPLCPSTGEKTLCHLRFRRRGCARRPGLDTLCLFGLEKAVPPSQVCDWNRYSIQKTLGSLEFPREQWRPPRPCSRKWSNVFCSILIWIYRVFRNRKIVTIFLQWKILYIAAWTDSFLEVWGMKKEQKWLDVFKLLFLLMIFIRNCAVIVHWFFLSKNIS